MRKGFYLKLAISNIKKNLNTYIPYIITCIGCIMTMYIIVAMAADDKLSTIDGGATTKISLWLGTFVIALFSLIFLFYTNSFLIKRRKKEFGLYDVLGMGKLHIMKSIFLETLIIAIISIVVGIALGGIFSKMMMLILLKMISVESVFSMDFSFASAGITTITFGIIFLFNLIGNLIKIGKNKTIDLLNGGKHGEKEPKTNILLLIIGIICLASGYFLALKSSKPQEAIWFFSIAVILVIIGTFALITAGSTAILKLLKKNKKYYYKANHFISISGMLYRMKQNAAGISSICILSTMVLVTISTTASLYFAVDNIVNNMINRDVIYTFYNNTPEEIEAYSDFFENIESKTGYKVSDIINYQYNRIQLEKIDTGFKISDYFSNSINTPIITLDEYNKHLTKKVEINSEEIIIDYKHGKEMGEIEIDGKKFTCVEGSKEINLTEEFTREFPGAVMVLRDEDVMRTVNSKLVTEVRCFLVGANIESIEAAAAIADDFNEEFEIRGSVATKSSMVKSLREAYGSFMFIGIFLGTLFLMATVLTMYYKQISEGYDDKQRFEILEKVGMSHKEIKETIGSQILMIFAIPIISAVIHTVFAFNMISGILAGFGQTDTMLVIYYTIITVIVFALIYLVSYRFTARAYYKIVK